MVNYSFIIPHRNSLRLLERCLDSIPYRDDIEIIIIDDNSDIESRAQASRKDTRIIFIDELHSKGAGRARNYGVKEAVGKWLVFADCDDYFVPGFLDVLDKYKDLDIEVVYYNAQAVHTVSLAPMPGFLRSRNNYFSSYDGSKKAEDAIRFKLHAPWWKMVRRDFIEKYQIQFEEVPKGNDVFFTYQVGTFAKKISVESKQLYVYTYNPDGITHGRKNKEIYLSSLHRMMKANSFLMYIGYPEWRYDIPRYWMRIIKHDGLGVFLQTVFTYCMNYKTLSSTKMEYIEKISPRINDGRGDV